MGFFGEDKTLGITRQKRRYDLPLNRSAGANFLTLLIALMTFLALLALSASFALSAMTERWSAGLENRVTIEIPAETKNGTLLSREEVHALTNRVNSFLENHPTVKTTHILTDNEIGELVKPWLGEDMLLDKIPLPGLISMEIQDKEETTLDALQRKIQGFAPHARIDSHETWLKDLLRFTGALQFASALLTIVIGLITATAIAGAVRARLAVHHEEVQLLHLMGASDNYISRQFQRHSRILAFEGSVIGAAAGMLALLAIGWSAGEMEINLLPNFHLSHIQIATLALLPFIAALIATFTARKTVFHTLARMP